MNAIVRNIVAIALIAVATFVANAQTASVPTTPAETSAGADLPKELKGRAFAWSRGSRIARAVVITFTDVGNINDIKGTLSFEDGDCAASSLAAPIEKMKVVGGVLSVDTPYSAECLKNETSPDAVGTRFFINVRMEKGATKWTAKGDVVLKSPTKTWQTYEIQLTSP